MRGWLNKGQLRSVLSGRVSAAGLCRGALYALLLCGLFLSGCTWSHSVVATGDSRTAYVVSEHPVGEAVVLRCTAGDRGVRCVEVEMKKSPNFLDLPPRAPLETVSVGAGVPSNAAVRSSSRSSASKSPSASARESRSHSGGKVEVFIKRLKSPEGQTRALFTVRLPGEPDEVVVTARLPNGRWFRKTLVAVPGKSQWTGMVVLPDSSQRPTKLAYFIRAVEDGKERFIGTKKSPQSKSNF